MGFPIDIDISIKDIRIAYVSERTIPWQRSFTRNDCIGENIYKVFFFETGSSVSNINEKKILHPSGSLNFLKEGVADYTRISNIVPCKSYGIIFSTHELIPYIFDKYFMQTLKMKNPEYISKLFNKAITLYEEKPPLWMLSLKTTLLEIIREFFLIFFEIKEVKIIPNYLQKSVEFMRENACFGPIIIKELAEEYQISVDHFRRTFKQYYHTTPKKFINSIKLNRAASLLAGTDKSICEIATLSGFNNISNFNALFKAEFGLTPYKLREKNDKIYL